MADEITRILLELIWSLPAELRPGIGHALGVLAVTQSYWQPTLVLVLSLVAIASLTVYVESFDG